MAMEQSFQNQGSALERSAAFLPATTREPRIKIAEAEAIVFVLPHADSHVQADALLCVAALYRVLVGFSREPALHLYWRPGIDLFSTGSQEQKTELGNAFVLVGFGEQRREDLAQMVLRFALEGKRIVGVVDGNGELWESVLPLFGISSSEFELFPKQGIATYAHQLQGQLECDARSNRLLLEAQSKSAGNLHNEISQALTVIRTFSGIRSLHMPEDERLSGLKTIQKLIVELASGDDSPTLAMLLERHRKAAAMVEPVLATFAERRPGCWIRPHMPPAEQDPLVEDLLKERVDHDPRYKLVLEYAPDRRATGLSLQKALELEVRLKNGEPAGALFTEMQSALSESGDSLHSMLNDLYDDRGRDLALLLEQEIERAKYIPDPQGTYTIVKEIDGTDLYSACQRYNIPLFHHNIPVAINFKEGSSRPLVMIIGGNEIERFLAIAEELVK